MTCSSGRQGFCFVGGEAGRGDGALEPGEQVFVELSVEFLGIQHGQPRGQQAVEVVRLVVVVCPLQPLGQGQLSENVKVGAMGVVDVDLPYQRHVAQHVAAFVAFVRAAVDDGNGELAVVAERYHHRHGKQAVDLTCDGGEVGPRIPGAAQFDGEKEIGPRLARVDGRVLKQPLVLAEFFVRELKEQVGLLPVRELGLVRIEGFA